MNPQSGHLTAELAQAVLDGHASEEDVRTVETHVHTCEECSTQFAQWKSVYARLGHLEALEPSDGFAAVVMARLQQERAAEAAAAAAIQAFDANGHLTTDVLLEYVDGELTGADQEAARTHIAACTDCAQQEAEWSALFGSIGAAGHYAPSTGFADSVLVAARVLAPQPVAQTKRQRAIAGARSWAHTAVARVRTRDRKGLAVLAGLCTAPAVVAATLMWVVLTHPLVTTSGLLRFALFKAGQIGDGLVGIVLGGTNDSAVLTALYSAFEMVVSAPGAAALGGLGVLMLMSLSTWVLFKNLAPMRGGMHPASMGQGFGRSRRLGTNG